MKTLVKVSMVLMFSLMTSGCLSSGAGSETGANGEIDGGSGDGGGGTPGTSAAKVTSVSANSVSSFGGQVVLTVNDISGGVASVESQSGPLSFSVSGNDITVSFSDDQYNVGSNHTLTITDNDGKTYGFDVSNTILIRSGLTITSQSILNAAIPYNPAARIHEASQKLYHMVAGVPSLIDASGNVQSIPFELGVGESFNTNPRLIGNAFYGHVMHSNAITFSLRRFNLDGTRDNAFTVVGTNVSPSLAVGEDSSYVYVISTASSTSVPLVRYAKADGSLDAGFNAPALSDSHGGTAFAFDATRANFVIHGSRIYLQMPVCKVGPCLTSYPYLAVYEQSNGAQVSVDVNLRHGGFSTLLTTTIEPMAPINHSVGLRVDDGGVFQFGQGGGGQVLRHNLSDFSLNSSFIPRVDMGAALSSLQWKDIDFHANPYTMQRYGFQLLNLPTFNIGDQHPGIAWKPLTSEFRVLDVVKLTSGNRLIVSVENSTGGPAPQMICGLIVSDDGTPLRGMREARFCQSMSWTNYNSGGLHYPQVQLMTDENGLSHKKVGNVYNYMFVTDKVWTVSFDVNE